MGVWDTGLYAGDFALDLRAAVSAVCRLPYDPGRLVDILSEREQHAATNPDDEDHPTFWLVVADQFAKRGIVCTRVRERALEIIDGDEDLTKLEQLGMKPSDLRKRRRMLEALRARIVATPASSKPRAVLREPQPLLMDVGDMLVYPIANGHPFNPYCPSKGALAERYRSRWTADGWAAIVIVDCGRAFDFLAWYRSVTLAEARSEKPAIDSLRSDVLWRLEGAGTCSASHFKKMALEKIGTVPVDREKLKRLFPTRMQPGISMAISDVSIANRMDTLPAGTLKSLDLPTSKGCPTIRGLDRILAD
jgi:hypothetical protein